MEPPPDAILMRPMTPADLAAVGELVADQRRNVEARDYERFLGLEGAHGAVLVQHGRVLGFATAMRYFEHGFLGPVVLRAEGDATGLAIALLARLVEALQREGVQTIEAEAASVEEAILSRMGFVGVRRTVVLERAPQPAPDAAPTGAMEPAHLLDIGTLDAAVAGFGRKEYIARLQEELPEAARVVERADEVVGYVLLRRAPKGYHLGPLVTRPGETEAARALLRRALAAGDDARVFALAPDDERALGLLAAEGFREVGALARMRAGAPPAPRDEAVATEWVLGGRITG